MQHGSPCQIKLGGFHIQIPPCFEVRLQAMCPKPLVDGEAGCVFLASIAHGERCGGGAGAPISDLHTANPWRKSNRCIIAPEDPWLDIPISKQSLSRLSTLFQAANCPVRVKTELPASLLPRSLHPRGGRAAPPRGHRQEKGHFMCVCCARDVSDGPFP